jgi:S-adenosylmethionine hydrolase
MPRPLVTLTTDFGTSSPYVAQMKGVILSLCRDAELIDISHAIGPQNVREGAVVLADATPLFPASTIHVAVVDPGVGTTRRILYAEIGSQQYVAPDNGLLSALTSREQPRRIVAIENREYWLSNVSQTFHGRDIMAPVAARLAAGLDPAQLGPSCQTLVTLDWPQPQLASDRIAGEVLCVDSFGNLITNIGRREVEAFGNGATIIVDCGGRQIRGLVTTYGAALSGELVALFDSQGRLEIASVAGNAARELHVKAGEPVIVHQR